MDMKSSAGQRTLRHFIRSEVSRILLKENQETHNRPPTEEEIEAIVKYVRDSRVARTDPKTVATVANYVKECTLPSSLILERVSSEVPAEGDILSFNPGSFTKVSLSSGKSAGHIAWKSYDKCIFRLVNPTRGWEVDYTMLREVAPQALMFDASAEQEVIVAGNYRIVSKEMIVEPDTNPNYGYRIPLFVLQET